MHLPSVVMAGQSSTQGRDGAAVDDHVLTIRKATPDDKAVLQRLADLDSRHRLTGGALLAEVDGVPVAAVSLQNGSVIADPFQHSVDLVRLLRLRRYQLTRQGGRWPLRSQLRRPGRARADRSSPT
jgi:hypothetical protein